MTIEFCTKALVHHDIFALPVSLCVWWMVRCYKL